MNAPSTPLIPATFDIAEPVAKLVDYYQTISPESVAQLGQYYAASAYFKDPFNEVHDSQAIAHIFEHMFLALKEPRFVVTNQIVQGDQCFLTWEFHFRFKNFDSNTPQVILGGSHLRFSNGGLVSYHRDYWDAAEELYEKIPLLGSLMRWIKKREKSARDSFRKA